MTTLSLNILPEAPEHSAAIDSLHDRGFGPGRFARTAFRLREGVNPAPGLSYVALVGTLLVGSVRLSPIRIGGSPALLLGPLAVEPAFMNRGIGTALIASALDAARAQGHTLALLVGDEPFYAKSGFVRVPHGKVRLPGPVDPDRILVCELKAAAFEGVEGMAEAVTG